MAKTRKAFDVEALDLAAIRLSTVALARIGRQQPSPSSTEFEASQWEDAVGPALQELDSLLNPAGLPFGDARRPCFIGRGGTRLRVASCVRGTLDRILTALRYEVLPAGEYEVERAGGKREKVAWPDHVRLLNPLQCIDVGEWTRLAELAAELDGEPAAAPSEPQEARPAVLLKGWREILIALGYNHNDEDRQKSSRG